jgi:hypothetical protein
MYALYSVTNHDIAKDTRCTKPESSTLGVLNAFVADKRFLQLISISYKERNIRR